MDKHIKKTSSVDYCIKSVQKQLDIFISKRYEVRFYYQIFDNLRVRTLLIDAESIMELKEKIAEQKAEILNEITEYKNGGQYVYN